MTHTGRTEVDALSGDDFREARRDRGSLKSHGARREKDNAPFGYL